MRTLRRASDKGILCWIALRAGQFWDWVDRRQIDAYAVSLVILYGTVELMRWAMRFAEAHHDKPGLEIAAIIAAVVTPYSALQAAAIKWLFEARKGSFESSQNAR